MQDSARDVLIAQTTLQAERESHARVELDRSALSARIDSLIADLSTATGFVQAAELGRSRAETLVETTQTDLHASQAALDSMRAASVSLEREVGAARRACQLYGSQI